MQIIRFLYVSGFFTMSHIAIENSYCGVINCLKLYEIVNSNLAK